MCAIRTLRELRILSHLKDHANIIRIQDAFLSKTQDDTHVISSVYLVTEQMDTDLHRVIQSQHLSMNHVRYFAWQLIRGVAFMHESNIIHRDLKPSNLFVNANCQLRIGDFGLSRVDSVDCSDQKLPAQTVLTSFPSPVSPIRRASNTSPPLTQYIATRWYRPPEILLFGSRYSPSVDLWAIGCIICEMMCCRAIFPGRTTADQLSLVMNFLGDDCVSAEDRLLISDVKVLERLLSLDKTTSVDRLSKLERWISNSHIINSIGCASLMDLLSDLLQYNTEKRPLAKECLTQAFVRDYEVQLGHQHAVSPSVPKSWWDFERRKDSFTFKQLSAMIEEDVLDLTAKP